MHCAPNNPGKRAKASSPGGLPPVAPPPGGMASTAPVLASDVTADNPPQIPGFLHLRGNPGGKVAAVFLDPQEPT